MIDIWFSDILIFIFYQQDLKHYLSLYNVIAEILSIYGELVLLKLVEEARLKKV